jgi:hypothetical protein
MVVADCPHAAAAEALFGSALSQAGLPEGVDVVVVDDEAAAAERWFVGSPSFFVDGLDLLPAAEARPALACRVYRHERGTLSGLPPEQALSDAVRARCSRP